MNKVLSDTCERCECRPAVELAGQRIKKLEQAATALGFTVTEGSIICPGITRGSLMFDMDATCGAKITKPVLASDEEKKRIAKLASLEEESKHILPDTREIVQMLKYQ